VGQVSETSGKKKNNAVASAKIRLLEPECGLRDGKARSLPQREKRNPSRVSTSSTSGGEEIRGRVARRRERASKKKGKKERTIRAKGLKKRYRDLSNVSIRHRDQDLGITS